MHYFSSPPLLYVIVQQDYFSDAKLLDTSNG
jgi:hypothetical protein